MDYQYSKYKQKENCNSWESESIGSDESGKGDFFGAPVVVVVVLDSEVLNEIKKQTYFHKIKDSKKCNDDQIKKLAPQIMKIFENKFYCSNLDVKKYNQLCKKYINQNILYSVLHNKAHSLINSNLPRVIDAFCEEKTHNFYLKKAKEKAVCIDKFIIKADSRYLSVAIASIIARYKFIIQIENMKKQTNVRIPLGASYNGNNSIITTCKQLLEKYTWEEIENNFVKKNFSNAIKKVKKELGICTPS